MGIKRLHEGDEKLQDGRQYVAAVHAAPAVVRLSVKKELSWGLQHSQECDLDEDIAHIHNINLKVVDDHEPAPEIVPTAITNSKVDNVTGHYQGQSWSWGNVCKCTLKTRECWLLHGPFKAQFKQYGFKYYGDSDGVGIS